VILLGSENVNRFHCTITAHTPSPGHSTCFADFCSTAVKTLGILSGYGVGVESAMDVIASCKSLERFHMIDLDHGHLVIDKVLHTLQNAKQKLEHGELDPRIEPPMFCNLTHMVLGWITPRWSFKGLHLVRTLTHLSLCHRDSTNPFFDLEAWVTEVLQECPPSLLVLLLPVTVEAYLLSFDAQTYYVERIRRGEVDSRAVLFFNCQEPIAGASDVGVFQSAASTMYRSGYAWPFALEHTWIQAEDFIERRRERLSLQCNRTSSMLGQNRWS